MPVAVIRRWHRRRADRAGVRGAALAVFRLSRSGRRAAAGAAVGGGGFAGAIEKKLAGLARLLPGVARPLAQLSAIVEGKEILLRQGDGLIEPGGQFRFDFEAWEAAAACPECRRSKCHARRSERRQPCRRPICESLRASPAHHVPPGRRTGRGRPIEPRRRKWFGRPWRPPARRRKSASNWPSCSIGWATCRGAANATRWSSSWTKTTSRPARTWVACWPKWGDASWRWPLSRGRSAIHAGYADAHYHLARTLDDLGRREQAEEHWRLFLVMAPDSPWADEAHARLGRGLQFPASPVS